MALTFHIEWVKASCQQPALRSNNEAEFSVEEEEKYKGYLPSNTVQADNISTQKLPQLYVVICGMKEEDVTALKECLQTHFPHLSKYETRFLYNDTELKDYNATTINKGSVGSFSYMIACQTIDEANQIRNALLDPVNGMCDEQPAISSKRSLGKSTQSNCASR